MVRLNDILDKVGEYNPTGDLSLIKKAYVFSAKAHQGQTRMSGEPYLNHPLEVAKILAELKMDVFTIVTGLLHDTVEDTSATLEEIEALFGSEIMFLVDGVTKTSKVVLRSKQERQAESFRKMLLSMAKDIRVVLIKLADRLHNMRTLQHHGSPLKMKSIAQETMDLYAPLANRLGIAWIKSELEDLSLRYINPEIYQDIKNKIAKKKDEREKYIEEVKTIIETNLKKENIKGSVSGRPKHFYSIYKKMESQSLDFDQVYDLLAFRIITETLGECYEALGIIHSLWKPVPGRFKDYIAMPKGNMYQSLHTTVIGPKGERLEIQLRTEEMHKIAEGGIAAHWRYKEGKANGNKEDKRFDWLRQMIEWQQDMEDPESFMENFRVDLFSEEVYAFTPKGDVIELPRGATPVDFAFRIHSDVGMHCSGARVNGAMVNLKYQLRNGDTVDIITSPRHYPSKDLLRTVKTSKARTSIMHWVRKEERERSLIVGREILEKGFRKHNTTFTEAEKSKEFKDAVKNLHLSSSEELISKIGFGSITQNQLFEKMFPGSGDKGPNKSRLKIGNIINKISRRKKEAVEVKGGGDILVRYAKCCNPITGDNISGFVSRGKGVTIHRSDCRFALESEPERRIAVRWSEDASKQTDVTIKVNCKDQKGILASMSIAITNAGANITSANVSTVSGKAQCLFSVEVNTLAHLEKVMSELKKAKGVFNVERIFSK